MVSTYSHRQEPQLPLDNEQIARLLEEIACLLQVQETNLFRVRAYRMAAETLRRLDQPAVQILDRDGLLGLAKLPGIAKSLGRAIEELCRTGRLSLLQRLRDEPMPKAFLRVGSGG
jgi:DNA polymerase (family 10)